MRLLLTNEKDSEQGRWSKFEAELTKRLSEATAKYNAELQSIQGQKNSLAVRLQEYEKNAFAVLGNAKHQERLATQAEVQNEIADMRGRIRELEAEQKLADEQKKIEVATVRTAMESALRSEKSKLEDRLLGAFGIAYHFYGGSFTPKGQPPLVSFSSGDISPLKIAFNASASSIRVVVMLSPT